MKFVLSYTSHAGADAKGNLESAEAAQKLLTNWSPSSAATIHQWVQRCDGAGGFSVIETDNAGELFKDLATWSAFLRFEVYPVLDILDAVPLQQEAIEKVASVL